MSAPPADPELHWLQHVYAGDGAPQLTWRAVATGALLGALLCLSNLYVQLKLGVAMAVAVTACILAHAASRLLTRVSRGRLTPLTLLETNAAQSVASAAGYATGCTMGSAVAAYLLVSGRSLSWLPLFAWTLTLAALGVCFAVPFKRRMINVEALPFPSGTAAAATLRSLVAAGDATPAAARLLGVAAIAGGVVALARDACGAWRWALPRLLRLPLTVGDLPLGCDVSVLLAGAGALIGVRTTLSMAVGALLGFGWLTPWARAHGGIDGSSLEATLAWTLWTGSAILATSSLVTLLLDGRALVRSLRSLVFSARTDDPLAAIEVPARWFWLGTAVFGLASAIIAQRCFAIPIGYGLVAVALSFVLTGVACRVTGETDVTPTGARGQITQLAYGALMPQQLVANLMTASITGSTSAAAADLLNDLKSGWLVGAHPRRQFVAQLIGSAIGAAVIVPAFLLLVPDAHALGGARFPAPAAAVLAGVAKVLAGGVSQLHPTIKWGMGAGAAIGGLLSLADRLLPARLAQRLPSTTGLGLALLLPATSTLAMFAGALIAAAYARARPDHSSRIVPIASGLIAGESVVGIVVALLAATGVLALS